MSKMLGRIRKLEGIMGSRELKELNWGENKGILGLWIMLAAMLIMLTEEGGSVEDSVKNLADILKIEPEHIHPVSYFSQTVMDLEVRLKGWGMIVLYHWGLEALKEVWSPTTSEVVGITPEQLQDQLREILLSEKGGDLKRSLEMKGGFRSVCGFWSLYPLPLPGATEDTA